MIRRCARCGTELGPFESDHPDGRVRVFGRRRPVPVYDGIEEYLCKPCHLDKGVLDRSAGVEGTDTVTVELLVGRRASWAAFLALGHKPITLTPRHLSDLARVLEDVRRTIRIATVVLRLVASELHRRGHDDLAATLAGVALLLGGRRKR
jgi:hypothetical protein